VSTFSLLIIGFLLLLLGQRFWGHLVNILMFPSRQQPAQVDITGRLGTLARSGGVLSIFGISLAVTWGWAPAFVWIIISIAIFTVFTQSGITWLSEFSEPRSSFLGIKSIIGEKAAILCHLALLSPLLLLVPFLLSVCAELILRHPALLILLCIHLLFALAVQHFRSSNNFVVVTLLIVSLGLIFFIADWLSNNPTFIQLPQSQLTKYGVGIVLFLAVVALKRYQKFLSGEAIAAVSTPATFLCGFIIALVICLEQPSIAIQAYYNDASFFSAVPLIFATITLGLSSLVTAMDSSVSEHTPRRSNASFFEGCFALLVFLILVSLPGKYPNIPVGLPNWFQGLTPLNTIEFMVQSFTNLAGNLPIASKHLQLFLLYLISVSGIILANSLFSFAVKTVNSEVISVKSAHLNPTLLISLITAVIFGLFLSLNYSANAWILIGTSSLLFLVTLHGTIFIGILRLQRPILLISVITCLSAVGLFSLLIMGGIFHSARHETLFWLLPHGMISVLFCLIIWHISVLAYTIKRRRRDS